MLGQFPGLLRRHSLPSTLPVLPGWGCWGSPGGFLFCLFCVGVSGPFCCSALPGPPFMDGIRLCGPIGNSDAGPLAPFAAVSDPVESRSELWLPLCVYLWWPVPFESWSCVPQLKKKSGQVAVESFLLAVVYLWAPAMLAPLVPG